MEKTKKKVVVKVKAVVKDKSVQKMQLPTRDTSRLVVLGQGFKSKEIKMDKAVDLSTLKIGGKLFSDIISSRPCIGNTTRAGLALQGITCKAVEVMPKNKKLWTVVIFTRKK